MASGLHYAHEKVGFDGKPLEIVHRDVTPQNIIVTYDGAVKLLDFGIAKASNRFGETRFGTLKGKVPYMSPEQCRGEPLDRRSDIFSLGIMLYELTLGKRLYQGKSDFEVLKQIVEGTVTRPRELDAEYPPALEEIVMRALEKEKEKRYQTARDIQADLEAMVRADRLHVSPIALTGFMEETFGQKIEAWREAQAKGVTLGEHLEKLPLPPESALADDDLEEIGETQAREAERIAQERAAFRQRIERAASGVHDLPEASLDAVTRALRAPEEDVAGGAAAAPPDAMGGDRRGAGGGDGGAWCCVVRSTHKPAAPVVAATPPPATSPVAAPIVPQASAPGAGRAAPPEVEQGRGGGRAERRKRRHRLHRDPARRRRGRATPCRHRDDAAAGAAGGDSVARRQAGAGGAGQARGRRHAAVGVEPVVQRQGRRRRQGADADQHEAAGGQAHRGAERTPSSRSTAPCRS